MCLPLFLSGAQHAAPLQTAAPVKATPVAQRAAAEHNVDLAQIRSQSQRVNALNGFDKGHYKVLVATDVASRGIHVDNVAHVINYDLPDLAEDFIHRVGRTGRAGLKGRASTLVSGAEIGELRAIERTLKLKIARKRADGYDSATMQPRPTKNTLDSRTLNRLPGEVFC